MAAIWDLIYRGGFLMIPIGICSFVALWVFFERFFNFRRASIDVAEFTSGIRNLIRNNRITESIVLCSDTPGPVAAVLHTALVSYSLSQKEIEEAIERTARYELPRLEHNLAVLSTMARVAPLLGLLGTVTGMIQTFYVIQTQAPFIEPSALAQGIWESLLTTACGLIISIPCHIAFDYLTSRVRGFAIDMERSSADIIDVLVELGHHE